MCATAGLSQWCKDYITIIEVLLNTRFHNYTLMCCTITSFIILFITLFITSFITSFMHFSLSQLVKKFSTQSDQVNKVGRLWIEIISIKYLLCLQLFHKLTQQLTVDERTVSTLEAVSHDDCHACVWCMKSRHTAIWFSQPHHTRLPAGSLQTWR